MAAYFKVVGDIFDRGKLDESIYYVQCVSRDLEMGAGIAKQFNKIFNTKYYSRARWASLSEFTRNNIKCLRVGRVFNLITKDKYYNKPTLVTLSDSLIALSSNIESLLMTNHKITEIRLPAIGCGLDKLKWSDVEPLLIKHVVSKFENSDIKFKVYFLPLEVQKHESCKEEKEKDI